MRTITPPSYKVYEIEEHPNPAACYDWVRDNVHDLAQGEIMELVYSLEALAKEIGGVVDYELSQAPARGLLGLHSYREPSSQSMRKRVE